MLLCFLLRNACRDLADGVEVLNVAAVVGNVAVEYQQVDLLTKISSRRNRLGDEIVRVGNMIYDYIRLCASEI